MSQSLDILETPVLREAIVHMIRDRDGEENVLPMDSGTFRDSTIKSKLDVQDFNIDVADFRLNDDRSTRVSIESGYERVTKDGIAHSSVVASSSNTTTITTRESKVKLDGDNENIHFVNYQDPGVIGPNDYDDFCQFVDSIATHSHPRNNRLDEATRAYIVAWALAVLNPLLEVTSHQLGQHSKR